MLLLGALCAALLAGSAGIAASRPAIDLTITYWPDGQAPDELKRWTLRCGPVGGTWPRRKAACRQLVRLGPGVFAPVPRDAVCTEIYGGPQRARVKGRLGKRRIWATFSRVNGCEIARWDRVSPWLLPAARNTP
jgi:hypothetical protein